MDFTKVTDTKVPIPPLNPDVMMKELPLDFLSKTMLPILAAPDLGGQGECSWVTGVKDMVCDVIRQPWTQYVGMGVAVVGVAVCSWRLSQYWVMDNMNSGIERTPQVSTSCRL